MSQNGAPRSDERKKGWPIGLIVPLQDPTPFSPFDPGAWRTAMEQLAREGHRVVELAITDPQRLDEEEVNRALASSGLRLSSITTGQAAAKEGLSLSSPDDHLRERALERIVDHMKLAAPHEAVVIVGLLRGAEGEPSLLEESLRYCAQAMPHVRLALEPLNRYESKLVNTVQEALSLVERVGVDNLGILFDTFHANIEESSPPAALQAAGQRLFHVHLADSNRWPPGYGHLAFETLWSGLETCDYRGTLVVESLVPPDAMSLLHLCTELQEQWN